MIYDKTTGRSRGFGFVTMSSAEEVEAAAQQFNGYVSFFHKIINFQNFNFCCISCLRLSIYFVNEL